MPLLRHLLDLDRARNEVDTGPIFKLLLHVILNFPDASTVVEQDGHSKRATPSGKGKEKIVSPAPSLPTAGTVFESKEAEQLMHQALRTTGQVQTLALRSLSCLPSTKSSRRSAGAAAEMGGQSVRQRRDLVLTFVEVGLAGADASLVAAAARALPVRPCDVAALLGGLVPAPTGASTPSKVGCVFVWYCLYLCWQLHEALSLLRLLFLFERCFNPVYNFSHCYFFSVLSFSLLPNISMVAGAKKAVTGIN